MSQTEGLALFKKILKECGLIISKDGQPNQLDIDVAYFKQKLKRHFDTPDGKAQIEIFFSGLSDHLESYNSFQNALLPTQTKHSTSSLLNSKETLIRSLLLIPSLQGEVVDALLEKIVEISNLNNNENNSLVKSIINQLRWLDHIENSSDLLDRLIGMVEICPLEIKKEIIYALPEIFVEVNHSDLLEKLTDLAANSNDIFVPIIDCLGNISIPLTDMDYTRDLVLNRLGSIDLESLAVAIQFLLSSANDQNILTTIQTIRVEVDLDHIYTLNKSKKNIISNQISNQNIKDGSPESLIIETFISVLLVNNSVRDTWLKLIESTNKDDKIWSLDLLTLAIIHFIPTMKKKVELILKSKVSLEIFNEKMFISCISKHLKLIERFTLEFVLMAEFLTRNSKGIISFSELASSIYSTTFFHSDLYYRQEVIGSLITNIGSGNSWEIECSLNCLSIISDINPSGALQFTVFIKGILDYLDRLSLDQIAKLFSIYTILSVKENMNHSDSGLINDLNMVIRKQLTHPSIKYKVVGITASLSMVKGLSCIYSKEIDDPDQVPLAGSSKVAPTPLDHPIFKQTISIIQLVELVCPKHQSFISFAYQKLSEMIYLKELHHDLVDWISTNLASSFNELFLFDAEEDAAKLIIPPSWPDKFQFAIWDDLNEGKVPFAINLLPTVIRYLSNPTESYHPDIVCSLFKLQGSCELFLKDSLDDIDALLGCGIVMFDKGDLEEIAKTPNNEFLSGLIYSLITISNWYRELINAFYKFEGIGMKDKVKERLSNLVEVENAMRYFNIKKHHLVDMGCLIFSDQKSSNKVKSDNDLHIDEIREKLHQLEVRTYRLLKAPGTSDNPNDISLNIVVSEEIQYLLSNVKSYLNSESTKSTSSFKNPSSLVKDSRNYVSPLYLSKCLKLFISKCQESLDEEMEVSSPEADLCLDCLQILVTLHPTTKVHTEDLHFQTVTKLCDVFNLAFSLIDYRLEVNLALKLQKLLSTIAQKVPLTNDIRDKVLTYTSYILSNSWDSAFKKDTVTLLLKEKLIYSPHPLAVVNEYLDKLLVPLSEDFKFEIPKEYPNFSNTLFHVYYNMLSGILVDAMSKLSDQSFSEESILDRIKSLSKTWHSFVKIATTASNRDILLTCLKHGKSFVEGFSRKAMPYLDAYLQSERQAVLIIFKAIQLGTRKLQNICNETKTSKDKVLSAAVPSCRGKMEMLVMMVKKVFKDNNMLEAYSIGDLKHRTINGQIQSSQFPVDDVFSEEEEEEEETPPNPPVKTLKKPRRKRLIKSRADELEHSPKRRKGEDILTPPKKEAIDLAYLNIYDDSE